MKRLSLSLLLLLAPGWAWSLDVPTGGPYDARIKFVDYNPADVVQIVGHYGFETHIQFAPGEAVTHVAIGDGSLSNCQGAHPKDCTAWWVAPVENHFFLKPVGEKPETNMTVLTNRRVYNFELSAHWSRGGSRPQDMTFQVSFRYPEDEAARALAQAQAKALRERLNKAHHAVPENLNYWVKGAEDLAPNRAFDNRHFTYLTFANNKAMPAVYLEHPDGSESLVNTHVEADTLVVHRVARKLVLRQGSAVACLFNQAYDPNGISHTTGTASVVLRK